MKILLQVAALLALAAAAAGTDECNNDNCFCPTSNRMDCYRRGISEPPAGDWPQITSLSLSDNNITRLHLDSFRGFPNLDVLDLGNNPLTELDLAVLAPISTLRNLRVPYTAITSLASSQADVVFQNLQLLYLNNNAIASLDPDLLAKVAPNLQNLELGSNPLVVEEGKAFINHPTLVELTASNLAKLNLGPQSFAQLPKVTRLVLANASITDISGAFATNSKLYSLQLYNNDIQEVRGGAFPSSSSIYQLNLDRNPSLSLIEASAVADAVQPKGYVQFSDSVVACTCDYATVYWWGKGKGVSVSTACQGDYKFCSFV